MVGGVDEALRPPAFGAAGWPLGTDALAPLVGVAASFEARCVVAAGLAADFAADFAAGLAADFDAAALFGTGVGFAPLTGAAAFLTGDGASLAAGALARDAERFTGAAFCGADLAMIVPSFGRQEEGDAR